MIACPNPDCPEHGIDKPVAPGSPWPPPPVPLLCGHCGTEIPIDLEEVPSE